MTKLLPFLRLHQLLVFPFFIKKLWMIFVYTSINYMLKVTVIDRKFHAHQSMRYHLK